MLIQQAGFYKGFTLTELLVVIGLIVLMTALVLPNFRLGGKQLALNRSANKVAQDFGRAAKLALRVEQYTCDIGTASAYGVYFNTSFPTSYIVFAECNGTNVYESGFDGIIETVSLESGVEISALSPSPSFSVVFTPPDPKISILPTSPTEAQVTLIVQGENITKIIKVNNKGSIDID